MVEMEVEVGVQVPMAGEEDRRRSEREETRTTVARADEEEQEADETIMETSHDEQGDINVSASTSARMLRSPSESSSSTSNSNSLSSDDERLLDKVLPAPKQRVSIYVQVFEEMMETVLQHESHLFNQNELEMLERFQKMSYPARYLFVRLFSRKNGWFRVARLGYHDELVDVQAAVDEICGTTAPTPVAGPSCCAGSSTLTHATANPAGATSASEDAASTSAKTSDDGQAGPSASSKKISVSLEESAAPRRTRRLGKQSSNCSIICLEDSDDEISKAQAASGSDSGHVAAQSGRDDVDVKGKSSATSRTKNKNGAIVKEASQKMSDPLSNRSIAEVKKDTHEFGLTRFAINEQTLADRKDIDELLSLLSLDELKGLGKDLRIASHYATRSVIIEAIRKTSSNQSTITSMFAVSAAKAKAKAEALLTITNGRRRQSTAADSRTDKGKGKARDDTNDEKVQKQRPTRQTEVLTYKILQHLGSCIKLESGPIRLFARLHLLYYRSVQYSEKTLTQAVLARFKIRNYPSYEVKRSFSVFPDRQALVDYEDALILERRMEELLGEASDPYASNRYRKGTKEDKERDMREALAIFEDVYPRWKEMVEVAKRRDEESARERREKGLEGDDKLTYYRKRFLAGWALTRVVHKGSTILARLHEYDREVEVMTTLLAQSCFRRGKRGEWYDRLALLYMHHYPRLTKLKGMDKTQCQEKAREICYEGLHHPWTHLIYHNSLGRRIVRLETALDIPKEERHPPVPTLRVATKRVIRGEKLSEGETGRKSIWRARDGDEVSVEDLSLQQYNREGWKGFHSENGILTTIFSLLFWDVIFAPIDGVFETAYQAGPLDLSTDAFCIVRADLVKERLDEIEAGKAAELLAKTDDRERENKTYCVGLKWGYEREDLAEIIQCFTPKALRMICRVYAEEWSHRVGGVPDLFLWNFEGRKCRFVEVKGPGDFLSETQKVWIDVLLSADVSVELCSVVQIHEEDDLSLSETESPRKAKTGKSAGQQSISPSGEENRRPRRKAESTSPKPSAKREMSPAIEHRPPKGLSKKRGSYAQLSAQAAEEKPPFKDKSEKMAKRPKLTSKQRRAKAQSTGSIIILSD